MNAQNETKGGAAIGGRNRIQSIDFGARARAVTLGGMRRGLLATAELVEACAAARRGVVMAAGAAVSWRHAVEARPGDWSLSSIVAGARCSSFVERPGLPAVEAAAEVEAVARAVEGAAWLLMAPRLGPAVRSSWGPSFWRAAAARVAARQGEIVRRCAAAGADVVAAVRIAGGELGAALSIMAADAKAARVAALHGRINRRGAGGEFARLAARRRMERAAGRPSRADLVNRSLDRLRAEAEAQVKAAQVGSPEWRAIAARRIEAEAARRGTLGPVALPVRPEGKRRVEDSGAARAYRSAVVLGESSGARWLMRHAAKFALPMLERDDTGKRRLRSARAEASGNGGAEVERGADVAAEVVAVYRHAALALVPRYLRTLARLTAAGGGRVTVAKLAKLGGIFRRAAWRRAAAAAGSVIYSATGRGGRESALPWEVEGAEADAAGDALAVALGSDGAAGDDMPEAWAARVPSSDPRAIHSGGIGKRGPVELKAWRAIARARAEVHRKAAAVAKGGKGTGMIHKGKVELSATVASVSAALVGRPLPPAVVVALCTGSEDGISDKWRQRLAIFRKAAGIPAPDAPGAASKRFNAARCRTLHLSGRVPHRGDKREDSPAAEDWQAFECELVGAASRPLALVRS
jgi:hypothetical protein